MSDSEITYKAFTASQIKAWLYDGASVEGLNEYVISPVRANAILHNPFIKDEDVVATAAYCQGKVVGFTAMFPEHYVKPDVWCANATTLHVEKEFEGEFISYYLTKLLQDSTPYCLIGTDSAPASVLVDKLLGSKVTVFHRQRFVLNRKLRYERLRSLGSFVLEPFRLIRQRNNISRTISSIPSNLKVDYTNFIDNETYEFIRHNSQGDAFLRTKDALNWVLNSSFRTMAPVVGRDRLNLHFSHNTLSWKSCAAKVYIADLLVGFFHYVVRNDTVYVLLLYVNSEYENEVYANLVEHFVQEKPHALYSTYSGLNGFVCSSSISLESYDEPFYYTTPLKMKFDASLHIQGADGDMFV